VAAIEVDSELNINRLIVDRLSAGHRIDYLICDEAQFYTPDQIEQIAQLVDELTIDAYAFGILTDFRTKLFPGSARLIELADRVQYLQVEALCWCGSRALHNARTINGEMTTDGDQVLIGDINSADHVSYEVLCRKHYRSRLTSKRANAAHISEEPLPFSMGS
jgi:thymidine kinase